MYVTIQQATKLTGKSRATITRHISSGKLSKTDKGIDTTELMRVYGALIGVLDASPDTSQNDSVTTHDASLTHQNDALIDSLQAQIELLKTQVAQERDNATQWRQQAVMLLEHHAPIQDFNPTRQEDSLLWRKLFGRKTNG